MEGKSRGIWWPDGEWKPLEISSKARMREDMRTWLKAEMEEEQATKDTDRGQNHDTNGLAVKSVH